MEAVLAGGTQLDLGGEDFLGRMQRFVRVYRSELAQRWTEVKRVDLRYENGIAVAFNEPSQEESSQVAGL
jgi:cell division protein FtsQ